MDWESCHLQQFPTAEAEGKEEKSFFNVSGIQCSSHNMIRADIISYLPPIAKLTPMLTLSSCYISVSPKGQATAWELPPWCHSHKLAQAVTCTHFQDTGLWTLPKGPTSESRDLAHEFFVVLLGFFFLRAVIGSREIYFLSYSIYLFLLESSQTSLRAHTEDDVVDTSTHRRWVGRTHTACPVQPLLNKAGKSDCLEDFSHNDASSSLCKINKKAIFISFMIYWDTLQVSSQALLSFLDYQVLITLLLCLLQKDSYYRHETQSDGKPALAGSAFPLAAPRKC